MESNDSPEIPDGKRHQTSLASLRGRSEEQSEKAELLGEFMESNTVERATKTETDSRTEKKEWASLVGLCQT